MLEFMVSPLALSVLSKVQDQIDRFGAYAGFAGHALAAATARHRGRQLNVTMALWPQGRQ